MRQALVATEYVEIPITVDADPTGDDVYIAFVDKWKSPELDDFITAEWKPGAVNPYVARILVGPDGNAELDAGWSAVYWRAGDDPESPARPAGLIFGY